VKGGLENLMGGDTNFNSIGKEKRNINKQVKDRLSVDLGAMCSLDSIKSGVARKAK